MAPDIQRFSDVTALYQAAATVFADAAVAADSGRGGFNVALAGGSTPRGLYSRLADDAHWRSSVPWHDARFFWGDERHVPPDHEQSNYRMAYEAMLSKVPVRPEQVHRVRAEHSDPAIAAEWYEADVRASVEGEGGVPRFDLILLGIGADGHTASLFPGTPALSERTRLVVANRVESLGTDRITMTLPLLNAARLVVFVAAGAEKAEAVRKAIQPTDSAEVPARLVRPVNGRLVWLLDRAAASLLPGESHSANLDAS